jgi:hypothetical protein
MRQLRTPLLCCVLLTAGGCVPSVRSPLQQTIAADAGPSDSPPRDLAADAGPSDSLASDVFADGHSPSPEAGAIFEPSDAGNHRWYCSADAGAADPGAAVEPGSIGSVPGCAAVSTLPTAARIMLCDYGAAKIGGYGNCPVVYPVPPDLTSVDACLASWRFCGMTVAAFKGCIDEFACGHCPAVMACIFSGI